MCSAGTFVSSPTVPDPPSKRSVYPETPAAGSSSRGTPHVRVDGSAKVRADPSTFVMLVCTTANHAR